MATHKLLDAVNQMIVFADTCPHCKREQPQDAFTLADLMTLLYAGYPVEAYCMFCDEFWTVSLKKRIELGEVVASACGRVPPAARMP